MKKLSFFLSALIAFGGSAFAGTNVPHADTDYVKIPVQNSEGDADGVLEAISAISENGVFDVFVLHDNTLKKLEAKTGITLNNYQADVAENITWSAGGNLKTPVWPDNITCLSNYGQWKIGDADAHHVKGFEIDGSKNQYWAGAYINNKSSRDFSHLNPDTHIHLAVFTNNRSFENTEKRLYDWPVKFKFLRYDISGGDDANCAKMYLCENDKNNGLPWIGSMEINSWVAIDITLAQIEKLMVELGMQFDYTRLNNANTIQHIVAIETPNTNNDGAWYRCHGAQFGIDAVYLYTPETTLSEEAIDAKLDSDSANDYYATYSNNYSDVELQAAAGATLTVYNVTVENGVLTLTQRADNKVARGEAVLVKTNAATFTASPLNACTLTPAAENQLVATPALAATVKCGEDYKLYRLTYDNVTSKEGLGFYFGNEAGTQIAAQPNKAYLKVPATQTASLKGFRINPQPTHVEGIEIEDASQLNEPVYDLSGRRVENPTTGFYLQGNKKILVK